MYRIIKLEVKGSEVNIGKQAKPPEVPVRITPGDFHKFSKQKEPPQVSKGQPEVAASFNASKFPPRPF